MTISERKLTTTYNALLDVSDASHALDERGGDATVRQVLGIIMEAGLEKYLGVRLLHKHNDIRSGEMMLETSIDDNHGFALVTAPRDLSAVCASTCNSWQLTSDGFVPSEFSSPHLINSDGFDAHDNARVFCRLETAIKDLRVESVLGPCLTYSEYVKSHRPQADAKLLETTGPDDRSNIVRYAMSDDPAFLNSIKTKWVLEQILDGDGKMIWATGCVQTCYVFPEGGHSGTQTHITDNTSCVEHRKRNATSI